MSNVKVLKPHLPGGALKGLAVSCSCETSTERHGGKKGLTIVERFA
jgi:hypothetical protein